jgi:large subunit ribosomal protein L22
VPGLKTNERPGTRAVLRHCRISAYKVREVLDLIRGVEYDLAREILRFCERDAAIVVGKLLDSAVANAAHNDQLDPLELFVSSCFADEGTTLKRWRPRARGRATRIRKRTCHITVIVARLPEEEIRRRRAKVATEQADRRARRVAGARRARKAAGGLEDARIGRAAGVEAEERRVDDETAEHDLDDAVTEDAYDDDVTEDEDGDEVVADEGGDEVVEAVADAEAGDVEAKSDAGGDVGAEDSEDETTSASASEEED